MLLFHVIRQEHTEDARTAELFTCHILQKKISNTKNHTFSKNTKINTEKHTQKILIQLKISVKDDLV